MKEAAARQPCSSYLCFWLHTEINFQFCSNTTKWKKPATEMLLHDARISQHGLIDVDKIGMTTTNSNSDVIISINTCHTQHVSYVM